MVDAAAASEPQKLALNGAAAAVVTAAVFAAAQAQGSYGVRAWGLLGLALVAGAVLLLAAGLRPARQVTWAAAAFLTLGVWTAASTLWGGVASEAVAGLDRLLLAAAALLVGSLLGSDGRRARAVAAGVALAVTAVAVEVVVVLPFDPRHGGWLTESALVGPVGYKNAQGGLFAAAIPLLLWLAPAGSRAIRAATSAGAVVLISALLLTESRGALVALVIALGVQTLVDRRSGVRVAAACLGVSCAILFVTLAEIYTRLENPDRAGHALALYALVTLGLAGLAGFLAARFQPQVRPGRVLVVVVAVIAIAVAVAVGVRASPLATSSGGTSAPRLTDLTLSGRVEAWQAAWTMTESAPLHGHGVGSFARQWPVLRPADAGHILQPHNVELEQLAELGGVGLVLFIAGWSLLLRCPSRRDRPLAAAATAAAVVILIQASGDWTWSFPGLVAPVFLVVGAACGGPSSDLRSRLRWEALTTAAALAALTALAAPYLAHRAIAAASKEQASSPSRALSDAESAARLNPWDPRAYSLQGEILEAHGDYPAAARAYAKAARNSLEAWADRLNEARAAGLAGRHDIAEAACRSALLENPYIAQEAAAFCRQPGGRVWPLSTLSSGRAAGRYSRLLVSDGCGACRVTVRRGTVDAAVPGGFTFRDSAFAVLDLGAAKQRDAVSVTARVSLGRVPSGPLSVLDLRDGRDRLIYAIYINGRSRELFIYNPPGGFHHDSFVINLHVQVPLAPDTVTVGVDLQRDTTAEMRAGGRLRARMPGPGLASPSGARTGPPRYVEAGILFYESNRLDDPMAAVVSHIQVHAHAN